MDTTDNMYLTQSVIKESNKGTISLVKNQQDGKLYIKKEIIGPSYIYKKLEGKNHQYLPKIYKVKYIDGITVIIEEYIDAVPINKAELNEKQVLEAIKELCDVVLFLHNQYIIHRDIKPSNILWASDNHIRLIDFDISRTVSEEKDTDTRLLGTRGYAPPEQFAFAQTDRRTDIYAIGVTMKVLLGEKASISKYNRIIKKCTDLNPDERYQTILQVKEALDGNYRIKFKIMLVILFLSLIGYCGYNYYKSLDFKIGIQSNKDTQEISDTRKYAVDYISSKLQYVIDEYGDDYIIPNETYNGSYYLYYEDKRTPFMFLFNSNYDEDGITGNEIIVSVISQSGEVSSYLSANMKLTEMEAALKRNDPKCKFEHGYVGEPTEAYIAHIINGEYNIEYFWFDTKDKPTTKSESVIITPTVFFDESFDLEENNKQEQAKQSLTEYYNKEYPNNKIENIILNSSVVDRYLFELFYSNTNYPDNYSNDWFYVDKNTYEVTPIF